MRATARASQVGDAPRAAWIMLPSLDESTLGRISMSAAPSGLYDRRRPLNIADGLQNTIFRRLVIEARRASEENTRFVESLAGAF